MNGMLEFPIGFMSASEAGRRLRVDSQAVYRLVQRGILDGEQRNGRWHIEIASVERLAAAKNAAAASRAGNVASA
jgi:hypothetical protein